MSANGSYPIDRIRRDFPILSEQVHGKPLVYLDNGASAQKPSAVIDQISKTITEVEHISGTIEEAVRQQDNATDGIRDLKTSVIAVVRESTSSNYGNGEQTQDESAETSHETTADDDHVSDEIEEGAVASA